MKPLFLFIIFTGSCLLLTGSTVMAQKRPVKSPHIDSTASRPKDAHAYPQPLPAAEPKPAPTMEGIPKPQGLKPPTSISMPPAAPKADLVAEDSTITPPPLPAAGKEIPKPAPVTPPKPKHKKHNTPHATA
ncbi:hypothetical protein [Chitinophaga sp. MM2321]|uniref:hypothetical protein n=1 Tax=Chitinophaga sp. MM2321 TaxID=3137178 RepID=UPI0032D58AB9